MAGLMSTIGDCLEFAGDLAEYLGDEILEEVVDTVTDVGNLANSALNAAEAAVEVVGFVAGLADRIVCTQLDDVVEGISLLNEYMDETVEIRLEMVDIRNALEAISEGYIAESTADKIEQIFYRIGNQSPLLFQILNMANEKKHRLENIRVYTSSFAYAAECLDNSFQSVYSTLGYDRDDSSVTGLPQMGSSYDGYGGGGGGGRGF